MKMMAAPRLAALALLAALSTPACKPSGGSSGEAMPPPEPDPPLARGPFLAEVETESLVVAWSTSFEGVGRVEYGPDLAYGSAAEEGAPSTAHAVRITGLAPGETYRYRVLTADTVLAEGRSFRTARPPADPRLRFVAFGDCGSGDASQLAVAALIAAADPDLAIITGDLIYPRGEREWFDLLYFEPYAGLIDHIPFYASLGNHDVLTEDGAPYLEAFHLPHDNPLGTERYYSFDWANVHFVALDSNPRAVAGADMRAWLADDLRASGADWKLVYFHHALFSSALHGSDLELRAELEPILLAGAVDVVFAGHDHVYERTFPLQDSNPVNQAQDPHYTSPGGIIYIVTGGGGRPLYPKVTDNPFTAFFRSVHHLVRVEVAGRALVVTAIDVAGVEFDEITITK